MRHQSPETCQEEEDKERDQDLAESIWRTKRRRATGCCAGQSEQDTVVDFRVCQQHGLSKSVPEICGF